MGVKLQLKVNPIATLQEMWSVKVVPVLEEVLIEVIFYPSPFHLYLHEHPFLECVIRQILEFDLQSLPEKPSCVGWLLGEHGEIPYHFLSFSFPETFQSIEIKIPLKK